MVSHVVDGQRSLLLSPVKSSTMEQRYRFWICPVSSKEPKMAKVVVGKSLPWPKLVI